MQSRYDECFINAVRSMALDGMELHLLSARQLRCVDKSVASKHVPAMSVATERAVRQWCTGTLAVSGHQALALYSRDEGAIGVPEPASRAKKVKSGLKN